MVSKEFVDFPRDWIGTVNWVSSISMIMLDGNTAFNFAEHDHSKVNKSKCIRIKKISYGSIHLN